ncbi:MAG: hypothetical protein CMK59_12365 [Proteobacteria bacterium]|nr:hypothetical protein [Pseudomonadota bacterium]
MDVSYIEDIRLFQRLSPRAINALAGLFVLKRWSKGDTILRQGTPSNGVYLILEGEVQVTRVTGAGTFVVLNQLQKGQVFGTLSTIDGGVRGADCIAYSDVTLGYMSKEDFNDLIKGSSTLAMGFQVAIIRSIFYDLRKTNEEFAELSSLSVFEDIQLIEE